MAIINGTLGTDWLTDWSGDSWSVLNANWSGGNDVMTGGGGNDFYNVNSGGDQVNENSGNGNGIDTVRLMTVYET